MNKSEKILVLFGSPNKMGFTASLVQLFLKEYTSHLHNQSAVEYIYTYDTSYLPCRGCNQCQNAGGCVFNSQDNYDQLLDKITSADMVILAAPVYFLGFPAPLKAIIDRTQQRFVLKFGQETKGENKKLRKGGLIATCGSNNPNSFNHMKECTKMFFDCLDIGFSHKFFASNTDHPEMMKIFD